MDNYIKELEEENKELKEENQKYRQEIDKITNGIPSEWAYTILKKERDELRVYKDLWIQFCSLQSGDVLSITTEIEKLKRHNKQLVDEVVSAVLYLESTGISNKKYAYEPEHQMLNNFKKVIEKNRG